MFRRSPHLISILLFLLVTANALSAQEPVDGGVLPSAVIEEVVARLNAPETFRFSGGLRVPAASRIEGAVAVLEGDVEVAGDVDGELLVVNGDLVIRAGGTVGAGVIVVGGTFVVETGGVAEGEARVYTHPFQYRTREGIVEAIPEDAFAPGFLASDLGFGQARVTVRAGPAYNRVEGLPVRVGPVVQTAGSNPLTLEALAIWRSVSGLDLESDRLGYAFRMEQALGGRGTAFLGASAYKEVSAIEDRGMTDLESSLSTFLLRRDLRDHYEREGWSTFLALRPAQWPLRLTLTYREEEDATAAIQNPWTLRSADVPWRPLPLVAEGTTRTVEVGVRLDTTDDPVLPSDGWRLALGFERQVGGSLRLPAYFPLDAPVPDEVTPPGEPLESFTHGSLDLRRYARVSPTSRLHLRVAARGALTDVSLPPQRQSALGGEGTLPGHRAFALDCGARGSSYLARTGDGNPVREEHEVFASYGCDGTLLFQAEFQGVLPFSWNPVPDAWEDSELSSLLDLHPAWAVFFNAGKGWTRGEADEGAPRFDSPTRADIGVGLFLGPVGLYWSYPLNRKDQGPNFFVRLQRRF